ncbi:MAG: hypothetical protein RIC03_04500 [Cyclobacteriaceae bacterium]
MKKNIVQLVWQIIPVMIGVYLGFVISDWSAGNERKRQAKVLLDNLFTEIEANEKQLKDVIDYHLMLRDSSIYYSNPENKVEKPAFFQGTKAMKLIGSAYATGIQTGIINELPMEQIQMINQLYTIQSNYNDYGNIMMASLLDKDFSYKEEDIKKIARFLLVTMSDIVYLETELINEYARVKTELKR